MVIMQYYNIKKNLEVILSNDKIHSKNDLKKELEKLFQSSELTFYSHKENKVNPYVYSVIKKNEKKFKVIIYLKNITGSGWKNKLNIKRVQVTNVKNYKSDNFTKSDENNIMLLLGFYEFDNNPIWVAWDIYRYINHDTVRSCYITVDNLLRGYKNHYLETIDSSQKIWIFGKDKFIHFLDEYVKYNITRRKQ